MRIVFVRHGEPCYENDSLTETGLRQAESAAKRLKEEKIEEIWTSPLGRARETAEVTSEVVGIKVKTLDFMRELTWGSVDDEPIFADGHPWEIADEMARQGTDLNRHDWQTNPYFIRNRVVDSVRLVEKETDKWLSGYGYERNGFYYDHKSEEEIHRTVAVFSHGGSSGAAMGHILNLPFPYVCAMLHIEFTGITVIRMDKKGGPGTLPCLELANDHRHIRAG